MSPRPQGPFGSGGAGRTTDPRVNDALRKLTDSSWIGPGLTINKDKKVQVDVSAAFAVANRPTVADALGSVAPLGGPTLPVETTVNEIIAQMDTDRAKLNQALAALRTMGVIL